MHNAETGVVALCHHSVIWLLIWL